MNRFRVDLWGENTPTPHSEPWDTKGLGMPSVAGLEVLVNSRKAVRSAQVVDQQTNEVLVSYKAPCFYVE